MAIKWVQTATGQWVKSDDGMPEDHATSGDDRGPNGLVMGQPYDPKGGAINQKPSSNTNPGGLSGYHANKEAVRRLWNDAATKNHVAAAVADPYALNREAEMATRAQQLAVIERAKSAGMGYGPSAAGAMSRAGTDAALRAQMGVKGVRAGLAGGSAAHSSNALGTAAMAASDQQNAWKSLASNAFGARSSDLGAATEQAKMDHAHALANATFGQQATIANQGADLAGIGNRINAARQFGGIVADNKAADTGTFGFDLDRERQRTKQAQQAQNDSDARMAEYLKYVGTLLSLGAGAGV